jgi:hypothetical protein
MADQQSVMNPDSTAFLDEELEETIGIQDYEIKRIKLESNVLFRDKNWQQGLTLATRYSDRFIIGWSLFLFAILVGFCYIHLKLSAFIHFYWVMQVLLLYWRFFLSPVRNHQFSSAELYMQYRGYLQHGPNVKAHLRDFKYQYLLFIYLLWNMMLFASILHAMSDDFILNTLNNIIYDRGRYPNSLVESVIPALVVLGISINILGAVLAGKYQSTFPEQQTRKPNRIIQQAIMVIVAVSFLMLFLVAANLGTTYSKFWATQGNQNNWLWLFDDEDPLYHGRATIIIYYLMVYLGCTFVAFLILLGFAAFEMGAVRFMVDHTHETMEPTENNWEFRATLLRREKADKALIRARKASFVEIVTICFMMILGMWVFLYWGGTLIANESVNNVMNIIGYAILGIGVLWIFFFSQLYHAKNDGTHYYPTPKHNVHYVAWDERGMGSWKHYYREVWGKQKKLQAWITLWILFCMTLYILDWKRIWGGQETKGLMIDLTASFLDPNAVTVAAVIVSGALAIVGFLVAIQYRKESVGNSHFWCTLYKVLMGLMVYAHIRWVAMMPQIVRFIDFTSSEIFIAIGVMTGIYALAALALNLLIMPFIVKFDNFAVAKTEILVIIINTVILSFLMMLVFHAVMPMTDINGNVIDYGYPWRKGPEHEVKYYYANFEIAFLLLEIGARYVWWGGLQQYLFMSYFLNLWRKVFPKSKGYLLACGSAIIFGVIHAIDWPLMLCTGLMGLLWAYFWQKEYYDPNTGKVHRGNNLLLWGLVHGFGGSLIGMVLPFSMGVGPFNM